MFFSPIDGDRKLPACATRDIAAVAARLLLDHTWSGQGHVAVLGSKDLSFNDMARIMSEVLGKPVQFQQIPFDGYWRLAKFPGEALSRPPESRSFKRRDWMTACAKAARLLLPAIAEFLLHLG